jgi:hypothetical protein
LIDLSGNGFALTDAGAGVQFDFFAIGRPVRISWTRSDAQNAWLVLDRNGNDLIESGKEMFGNLTEQPAAPVRQRNGFAALKVFDGRAGGGNGDGFIDRNDQIYARLRLWVDGNHNGISERSELIRLNAAGVLRISLDYKESRYVDEFGNAFRYRSKVVDDRGADVGRFAYDVFLLRQPS